MIREPREGIDVEALYTAETAPLPFAGDTRPGRSAGSGWLVAQEYPIPSVAVAAEAIVSGLRNGVQLLWLPMDYREGRADISTFRRISSIAIYGAYDMERLIAGIDLETTPVVIEADASMIPWAAAWVAGARRQSYEPEELLGGFACDPIGSPAATGYSGQSLQRSFDSMIDLTSWTRDHAPSLRSVLVSSSQYHDAGASPAAELALTLATGVEYLRRLTSAGFSVEAAASQMMFAMSAGTEVFIEIAKLRAARLLWAKVLRAAGAEAAASKMWLHARGSRRTLTRREPELNIVRGGIQGFVAAAGGADSIAIRPFDELLWQPEEHSRRLALTTQHLLAEEAHLGRMTDPAGGSWCVESLTDSLARAAWKLFQRIERLGGMARCFVSGRVHKIVDRTDRLRYQAAHCRRDLVIGVSAFVHLDKPPPERRSPAEADSWEYLTEKDYQALEATGDSLEALARAIRTAAAAGGVTRGELTAKAIAAVNDGALLLPVWELFDEFEDFPAEPLDSLIPRRLAWLFERYRDDSDRILEERGLRPRAFFAWFGEAKKARAAFVRRALATGGIEVVEGGPYADATTAAEGFADSQSDFVVLGAGDPDLVAESALSCRERGARRVLLAGRGGKRGAELREAGIDDALYDGCDVIDIFRSLYEIFREALH
ncbi:MAG: methylmalonyl-CoA mutase family protein [Thermoanaerobaculia bacterium]